LGRTVTPHTRRRGLPGPAARAQGTLTRALGSRLVAPMKGAVRSRRTRSSSRRPRQRGERGATGNSLLCAILENHVSDADLANGPEVGAQGVTEHRAANLRPNATWSDTELVGRLYWIYGEGA